MSGSGAVLNSDGSVTYTPPSTPASGNTASFGFTVTDTDGLSSNATATVGLTSPSPTPITPAQLQTLTADVKAVFLDATQHKSTTADANKLATDFTSFNVTEPNLAATLTQALTPTTGATAAGTLGSDIASQFYPTIATDLANSGKGLAGALTAMVTETQLAGADYTLRSHYGQSASTALAGTLQDFKFG